MHIKTKILTLVALRISDQVIIGHILGVIMPLHDVAGVGSIVLKGLYVFQAALDKHVVVVAHRELVLAFIFFFGYQHFELLCS